MRELIIAMLVLWKSHNYIVGIPFALAFLDQIALYYMTH